MLKKFSLLVLLSGYYFSLIAQSGTISGTVLDQSTGESIIGANVVIEGTTQGAPTDIDGKFRIARIEPGTYNLVVSFISYKTLKIENVKVVPNGVISLNLTLEEDLGDLSEVTITAARETGTDFAMVSEIRKSLQVVSGISKDQIKLSVDRDAAQVMRRVPGITIVENRFVMVRGIPERYNQVMINNVTAPSTEIDRRTFSFDLIPSGVLDRMLIYKSSTPQDPGDVAGGLIKVYTSNVSEENFTTIDIGIGIRANTTFNPYYLTEGSPTDVLGFDNGFRSLPGNFPTTDVMQSIPSNSPIRAEAGQSLNNNYTLRERTALPDRKIGVTFGRNYNLKNLKISHITSLGLSQSHQYYRRDFFRYFDWSDQTNPIDPRFAFNDDFYEKEKRVGILSNWRISWNAFNKIEFKNMFNTIGENTSTLREGFDFIQQPDALLNNYEFGYRSRKIYNGQLEGTHNFAKSESTLNWIVGLNYLSDDEPDLRRFRTKQPLNNPEAPFEVITASNINLNDVGRYFGRLDEFTVSNAMNYQKRLGGSEDRPSSLSFGYLAEYRDREFDSRRVNYFLPGFVPFERQLEIIQQPLETLFSPDNFSTNNGWVILEGTRGLDAYTGSNLLTAGYVSGVLPMGRFNITGGIRLEYNDQRLNSNDDTNAEVEVVNQVFSPLYNLNVDYQLTDKSLIRFGYSKAVNRPEFRELAPFVFYDFELEATRFGNDTLKVADIHNLDLRIETYPRPGEMISFGVFYKYFINPIESRIVITTESPSFTFGNALDAFSWGFEFELKKSLMGITGSTFIDKLSANVNASLIWSRVDYGEDELLAQDRERAMQGQSPYIVNAGLNYLNEKNGLLVGFAYNIFGDRIFAVGNEQFPTVYELPRHALDMTVSKRLSPKTSMKIGIQDIFNAQYRFFQDSNLNARIDRGVDHPIFTFRRGTLYTATLSYNF